MNQSVTHTTRKRFFLWMVAIYVVCLHLLVAVLVVKTDFIPKLKIKLGLAEPHALHIQNMLLFHGWMDESVPDGSIVFLGDSITQGLATTAVVPNSINYGIGWEKTADLLDSLPIYHSLNRSKAIILEIGINDIMEGRQRGLQERYAQIVRALPPNKPLIWTSVMPIHPQPYMKMDPVDIARANQAIKLLCEKRGNCVFVDLGQVLATPDGQIITSYFLADGVHLSTAGYDKWVAALKRALQPTLSENRLEQPLTGHIMLQSR